MPSLNFIDEPSRFDTLETWERHLAFLKRLPPDTVLLMDLIQTAEEEIARKRQQQGCQF
jgi:hypothetical protein